MPMSRMNSYRRNQPWSGMGVGGGNPMIPMLGTLGGGMGGQQSQTPGMPFGLVPTLEQVISMGPWARNRVAQETGNKNYTF